MAIVRKQRRSFINECDAMKKENKIQIRNSTAELLIFLIGRRNYSEFQNSSELSKIVRQHEFLNLGCSGNY